MEPAMRQAPKTTTVTAWNRRVAGGIQDAPPAKRVGWPLLWIAAQAPTAAMIHPATPISIRDAESTDPVSRLLIHERYGGRTPLRLPVLSGEQSRGERFQRGHELVELTG